MYKQLNRYREAKARVRIVKYSRCSSDEQKKNGYTVKDQLDFIEIFAQENDLLVVGEYVDEGVSATLEISKRKALDKLIKDAKAGKFDIVVFKCIDRFFRNVAEYYECQKQLQKAGVTWISIEEADLDPEDDDAAFKINIYLTMAEYEAKKTSKRIKFNNTMRIKNKQVVTGNQNFHFPWIVVGEPRNRHLERNMEKADVLYDILEHFETHQSKAKTLAYYNMKYGEQMTLKTLTNILTNTLLYGNYKGVPEFVEAYITKERFDKIQDILTRNAKHFEGVNRTFLFTGIIKCRCCGRNLIGNSANQKTPYPVMSYRCNKYRLEKACPNNHSISEKKIEKQLLENLEQYITNEIIRVETIEEAEPIGVDNTKKIVALKKEMERLNVMFRKDRIDEEEYDKEYLVLENELKKLEGTEVKEERNIDYLKGILESDFRTIYAALDKEHQKAFWRNTIKEFTIGENRKIVPESIIFF